MIRCVQHQRPVVEVSVWDVAFCVKSKGIYKPYTYTQWLSRHISACIDLGCHTRRCSHSNYKESETWIQWWIQLFSGKIHSRFYVAHSWISCCRERKILGSNYLGNFCTPYMSKLNLSLAQPAGKKWTRRSKMKGENVSLTRERCLPEAKAKLLKFSFFQWWQKLRVGMRTAMKRHSSFLFVGAGWLWVHHLCQSWGNIAWQNLF